MNKNKIKEIHFAGYSQKKNTVKTGGVKRYEELFVQLNQKGYKIVWFNGKHSHLGDNQIIVKNLIDYWRLFYNNNKTAIIIFDESKYLVPKFISLFTNARVFLCPRGNKIIHNPRNSIINSLKKGLFSFFYNTADGLVFQTHAQKKEFFKMYWIKNQSVSVINNNINTSWIDRIEETKEKRHCQRIGFIGDNSKRKGLDVLLKAFEIVNKRKNNIELHLCGDIQSTTNNKSIHYYGRLNNLNEFFNNIDILIVCSRYDSFPNVILEALKANVPVLGTNNEIFRELLQYDNLVFDLDPVVLSNKIIDLINYNSQYEEVKKNCITLKKNYTFDWSQKFIDVITKSI